MRFHFIFEGDVNPVNRLWSRSFVVARRQSVVTLGDKLDSAHKAKGVPPLPATAVLERRSGSAAGFSLVLLQLALMAPGGSGGLTRRQRD